MSENETTTISSEVTEMPNKTIESPDLSGFNFLSQHVLDTEPKEGTEPRTLDNLIALNDVLNLLDKVGNLSNTIINTNVTTDTELDKITKKPAVIDETITNNKSETNDDLFSFLNTLDDLSQALQNIKQKMTSDELDDTTKALFATTKTDETTAGVPNLDFLNILDFGIPTTTTPISTTTTTTIATTTTTLIPATTTLEKSGNMFFIYTIKASQGEFTAVSDANRGNGL